MVAVSLEPGRPLDDSDLRIIQVIWRLQVGHHRHVRVYENLKETLFGIVRCLSSAIDAKDPYTCGHSERVARIAVRLGEEMHLARGEISDLYLAGLLHDVGKIGIRDEVLCKPGPLTPEEQRHVQEHPIIGDRIVSNVTRLAYLRPAVRGHHERFDGEGYPDSLVGEAIPKMARVLAVADSCDAMMSARRYRPALAPARIEAIFRGGSATQWDPEIVRSFFACRHDLYAVCQRGLGQSVYMAVERAASESSQILARLDLQILECPSLNPKLPEPIRFPRSPARRSDGRGRGGFADGRHIVRLVPDQGLLERLGDQAHPPVECQVRPCPLDHHQDPISKPDEKQDVHEQPEQPGDVSRGLERPDPGHRGPPSDRGEHPLIDIMERPARPALEGPEDVLGGVPTLLHRGGATPGTTDPSSSMWARSPMT